MWRLRHCFSLYIWVWQFYTIVSVLVPSEKRAVGFELYASGIQEGPVSSKGGIERTLQEPALLQRKSITNSASQTRMPSGIPAGSLTHGGERKRVPVRPLSSSLHRAVRFPKHSETHLWIAHKHLKHRLPLAVFTERSHRKLDTTNNALPTRPPEDPIRVVERSSVFEGGLTARAARKRFIAKQLRLAAEQDEEAENDDTAKDEGQEATQKGDALDAADEENFGTKGTDVQRADQPRLSFSQYEKIANIRRAQTLEFEAKLLEEKAKYQKRLARGARLDKTGFPICNMTKIAPLEFVPTLDETRHRVDHTVTGKLDGQTLTIFSKRRATITYDVESIELPIFNVADTGEACWGFPYYGVDQLFCATNKLTRNAWINAISEAWFCQNEGLQGTLPSIAKAEAEMETVQKAKRPTPPPKKEATKPEALVDINVGEDKKGNSVVTVNGKPIAIGGP